ncbi:hypothetical protein NEUTE2DRAFT_70335 [Neurospora tetrasperma FGSC 2509]|nr:hypothetical protein NEUTE2DRAFT_70335 [Neurospora tetrasperma FGSC 2509]
MAKVEVGSPQYFLGQATCKSGNPNRIADCSVWWVEDGTGAALTTNGKQFYATSYQLPTSTPTGHYDLPRASKRRGATLVHNSGPVQSIVSCVSTTSILKGNDETEVYAAPTLDDELLLIYPPESELPDHVPLSLDPHIRDFNK